MIKLRDFGSGGERRSERQTADLAGMVVEALMPPLVRGAELWRTGSRGLPGDLDVGTCSCCLVTAGDRAGVVVDVMPLG